VRSAHRWQPCALLLVVALAVLAAPTWAAEDHDNTDPTAWQWYYGQTEAQLSAVIATGYRIVDLEVEQASPARFTAALVQNTGSYAKGWWWYYGQSLNGISGLLSANNARLVDIEPYEVSGTIRYAAVMVSNTGADAKAWWWAVSTDLNDLINTSGANNARVVDIEEKVLLGQTWYAAIMISNTGADAKEWYWWIGASSSFVSNEIAAKGLRLVDLERRSNGTYDVVLVKNTEGMHWWWWLGLTEAGLSAEVAQAGARIQSIQRVDSGGTPYFYVVLHNNSNALTTRIGDILRNGSDGVSGLYLKEVNGGVRAGLQQGFAFEPASTIKTLMHAHAMHEILLGAASLTEILTVWTGISGNSCPIYTGPIIESMTTVLADMMMNSDNNRTMAIRDRFGEGNINFTAASLGMTSTLLQHTLGCGNEAMVSPNSLSLVDGGRLHEAVANGYLGGFRQEFYDHMLTSVSGYGGNRLGTIIDQEGAALGLSTLVMNDFKSRMAMAYKGGSYGYGNPLDYYWSVLAWSEIPFISGGAVVSKEYVSGIFIHDNSSSTIIGSTMDEASAELLRDEIRAALQTWKNAEVSAWNDLGGALAGFSNMNLVGHGSLVGGTEATSVMTGAIPNDAATLVIGYSFLNVPFKGGVFGPNPDVMIFNIPTGAEGSISLPTTWPAGIPGGVSFYEQWWMLDAGAPKGAASSNTIRGTTP
jgi:hypothetical protein